MAVQTDEVRDVIDFAPEGFLVTSIYLNMDSSEFPSQGLLETSFDSLMHDAESRRKYIEGSVSHDARESIRGDLSKTREFFASGIDRTDTNGLAIFSCSSRDFWQVVYMPEEVSSLVSFADHPHVSPIATFLSHSKPTAILLTDRQQARIFTMNGGEVREWTDFEDWVPSRSAAGGWSQMRYQRRSDNWARHHIDHATELTLKLLQHYPFDWLILGSDVDAEHDLKAELHPYLKDRVIGEIHVRIDADAAEVLEKARELREHTEGEYIGALVSQIQEFARAGGRGTMGLADSIQALNGQKVHILLVQNGFTAAGATCPACGLLSAEPVDVCPGCGEKATKVDDVVDLAIQKALELGSNVEVATEFEQLAPIECIGTVMYY